MRDPLTWSFPLGRLFGINVRVHWLFPVVGVGLILRAAFQKNVIDGTWLDVAMLEALLFLSILLHEFGHCFGARTVDGDAHDILMWPLGGLAYVEVPHTARANFIATAAGPLVNIVLCIACALALIFLYDVVPPLNPLDPAGTWYKDAHSAISIFRVEANGEIQLCRWGGGIEKFNDIWVIVLARLFWVNWFLALLNLLVIGFPLDGGRLFQCMLWPYVGYRQSMLVAIFAGYVVMFIIGIFAIVMNELLPLCLAVFIYVSCNQQWIVLETGGEDSMFGYDFSQGYTSLERGEPQPAAPRRRQSWWQRWQQRRATRRMQREQEEREAEERRMDELLQKVQAQGLPALTEEERRFLKRVSDRYRKH